MMRALTLHQPWASAIFDLGKDIENRSRLLPPAELLKEPRPFFAVHAGLHYDHSPEEATLLRDAKLSLTYNLKGYPFPEGIAVPSKDEVPQGAIIGVARVRHVLDTRFAVPPDIIGARPYTAKPNTVDAMRLHFESVRREAEAMTRAPWWLGPIGWQLFDRVKIEPVPCKGMLGVWTLPEELAALVRCRVVRAQGGIDLGCGCIDCLPPLGVT